MSHSKHLALLAVPFLVALLAGCPNERGGGEGLSISASPDSMRFIMRQSQPVPSRQGVHWPQLSSM